MHPTSYFGFGFMFFKLMSDLNTTQFLCWIQNYKLIHNSIQTGSALIHHGSTYIESDPNHVVHKDAHLAMGPTWGWGLGKLKDLVGPIHIQKVNPILSSSSLGSVSHKFWSSLIPLVLIVQNWCTVDPIQLSSPWIMCNTRGFLVCGPLKWTIRWAPLWGAYGVWTKKKKGCAIG